MNPQRSVTAVVTFEDELIGTVGPFPMDSPWWNDVAPVSDRFSATLGVPAVVLRLLDVTGGWRSRGGHVRYHVEALEQPRITLPRDVDLEALKPHPLRAEFATASGLREAFRWAAELIPQVGPPVQVKSWNLGAVFRMPTARGPVWLKGLPSFAAHEPDTIRWIGRPSMTPEVLDARPGWMLMSDLPGEDCWGAPPEIAREVIPAWVKAVHGLEVPPWLPDRSPAALASGLAALLAGRAGQELEERELEAAHRLLERLPSIVDELAGCGLPSGLVHGDFHPGNWRSDGSRTAILDFADAHHGHPALDGLRPREYTPEIWPAAREAWISAWSSAVPGSDPARALTLAEPLSKVQYAIRYQEFLDGIEPSERIYHEGDPAGELRDVL